MFMLLSSAYDYISLGSDKGWQKCKYLYMSKPEDRKAKYKERSSKTKHTTLEKIKQLKINDLNRMVDCCDEEYTEIYGVSNAGKQCTMSSFFNLVVSKETAEQIKSIYNDKRVDNIVDKLIEYRLISKGDSQEMIRFLSNYGFVTDDSSEKRFKTLIDIFHFQDIIEIINLEDIDNIPDFIKRNNFPDFATYIVNEVNNEVMKHLVTYKYHKNGIYIMIDDNITSRINYKDIVYNDIVYIYKNNRK